LDPRRIPWELVEKYSVRGPRYTSYPTAPHFRPDVDLEAIGRRWQGAGEGPDGGLSVYVHVPYCRRRCLYCGCHTEGVGDREDLSPYVDGLLAELALADRTIGTDSPPVRQLALGGGTPTILPPAELDRFLADLLGRWPAAAGAELSAEIDPRTIHGDVLDVLFEHGFNRVSLGVQDLDPDVQQVVGRIQPAEMVERLVSRLRSYDPAPSINFDLIHGLPRQTPLGWARTVEQVVRMAPDRVAVFGYAHVPWMRPHQRALEHEPVPDARARVELLGRAWEGFGEAGYVAIGFDHFARPDDELATAAAEGTLHRNFMGYTTHRGLDQIGLGASAISAVGATYTQDAKELGAWRELLDAGRMPWERGMLLDEDDLLRREVILDLSCNLRLDFARFSVEHGFAFADRFGAELQQLSVLADDGLIELDDDGIRVTPTGRFLVRVVCMAFDRYLDADRARYSRTV